MPEDPHKELEAETTDRGHHSVGILDIVDKLVKLVAAGALVFGAFIANSFQSKMTGTTLLSQREQSETQLRASMFTSLIDPVVGSQKGAAIHPDRERLLVELLALNFHEHFELKPLMLHADERLATEQPEGMSREQAEKSRESLRSIARRVTAQEIASVIREETASKPAEDGCPLYILTFKEKLSNGDQNQAEQPSPTCQFYKKFQEPLSVTSPDKKYTLSMVVSAPDWENETFKVSVTVMTNPTGTEQEYQDITYKFPLTWFSFPLTDNTLLPDGNRFAVILSAVNKNESARLELIWFPKDYVTPRERPLDYRQYLRLVGNQ
jgi:hypothetical protein